MSAVRGRPEPFVERRAPGSTPPPRSRRRHSSHRPSAEALPRWRRILSGGLWTVIVLGTLAYATSLLVPLWFQLHDERLLIVTSGSMAPYFGAGDAVVMHAIDNASDLKEGQVVSFWPLGTSQLVTHRIVELVRLPVMTTDASGKSVPTIDPSTGKAAETEYIVTKGDANQSQDPDATPVTRVRGVVLRVHHDWGRVLAWSESPAGRATMLVPPLLALGTLEVLALRDGRRWRRSAPAPRPEDQAIDDYLLG